MYRPTPLTALLALGFVALVGAGCGSSDAPGGGPGGGPGGPYGEMATPAVEVVQARYGSLPLEQRLSGTVQAENQVAIYPEISSPIVRVAAQNGDFVREGDALVVLRDTQYREQLRQAEASLQIAQAEAKRTEANLRELRSRLERTEQLAEKQYESAQDVEALRAQVDGAEATYEQSLGRIAQAEATVEEAREALRRTVVRAPISGYVGQRNAEVGMRVDGSTRLFVIGNFEVVKVQVSLTDNMIGRINEGQTALITSETLGGQVIRAEVSRISPFLEAGSYSAGAEIDVPNGGGLLRPGMFVAVDVLYGESEQATLVPTSALYENPDTGVLGIYVASSLGPEIALEAPETFDEENPPPLTEPTPMTFREVQVLAQGRDMAGVAGVQPGDWVVTMGQNLLTQTAGTERVEARVRPVTWERVAGLQGLQDQDLLRQFMEKQQRMAKETFDDISDAATPPRTARTVAASQP